MTELILEDYCQVLQGGMQHVTGVTQFRFVAELSIGGQLLRVRDDGRQGVPLFDLGLLVTNYSKMMAAFDLARQETGYLLLIRN